MDLKQRGLRVATVENLESADLQESKNGGGDALIGDATPGCLFHAEHDFVLQLVKPGGNLALNRPEGYNACRHQQEKG